MVKNSRLGGILLRTAAVAALGVSSAVVVGAGPAAAVPFRCSSYVSGSAAKATCLDGTGQFRAVAICRYQGSNHEEYGQWTNTGRGSLSSRTCSTGYLYGAKHQVRG